MLLELPPSQGLQVTVQSNKAERKKRLVDQRKKENAGSREKPTQPQQDKYMEEKGVPSTVGLEELVIHMESNGNSLPCLTAHNPAQ